MFVGFYVFVVYLGEIGWMVNFVVDWDYCDFWFVWYGYWYDFDFFCVDRG